jgi:transcriptional regulator with XRE-family HTH domain
MGEPITEGLREAINVSLLTREQIADAAGVAASVVSRFMRRQNSMTLTTADRLASTLGLRLVEVEPLRRKKR